MATGKGRDALMARSIMLTRDEAELLVDLLLLTDNGHGNDLSSQLRELFGMCSVDEQLKALGVTIDEYRKQFGGKFL